MPASSFSRYDTISYDAAQEGLLWGKDIRNKSKEEGQTRQIALNQSRSKPNNQFSSSYH